MEMIVDRIEKTDKGYAVVCETDEGTRTLFYSEKVSFKTGDVLIEKNGNIQVDREKTDKRRKDILALQNDLFE